MRRGGGFAAASPPRTALFVRARPKYICKLFIYRGPVRDLKTRAWLDRLARRRDDAVASDLVALGPPSQHRVGLLRRVDHRAASRTAGGTPSPRNTETAWRCRHGLLASDRLRTDRFRGQALSVHSKTCFRGRSQRFRGPRVRPEVVEIDPDRATFVLTRY